MTPVLHPHPGGGALARSGRVPGRAEAKRAMHEAAVVQNTLPGRASAMHYECMEITEWWPRLSHDSREWLMEHNGEALTPAVLSAIEAAGGVVASDAWWVGQTGPAGFFLSDAAVDWIEEKANDE